ncbi:MAG: citrate/2-methylcitrate synthase [Pseudomonadales bacterium]
MTAIDHETAETIHTGLIGIQFAKSAISEIAGDTGELYYRGYAIHDLAAEPDYERVAFLLLHGEWPSEDQINSFRAKLLEFRRLPESILDLVDALRDATPHTALRTVLSAMEPPVSPGGDLLEGGIELIAAIPLIITAHHAARKGRLRPVPVLELDIASDFLSQLLDRPITDLERRAINLDFVLHAEHGANASTFAARVVASTEASAVGAVTAALAALDGPLHGGAPAAVSTLLDKFESADAVRDYVISRQARREPVHGFGHRVYRCEDPRARHYRDIAAELGQGHDGSDQTLTLLDSMVDAMSPYRRFGIAVNDDLYAAAVYRLLDLPKDLFTSIFAASRISGWIAHVIEQRSNNVLIRPRLSYAGHPPRELPRRERA